MHPGCVWGLWISDLDSGSFFERKRKPGMKKRRSLESIKKGSIKRDEERTRRKQGKHVWNFDAHDALGDCKAWLREVSLAVVADGNFMPAICNLRPYSGRDEKWHCQTNFYTPHSHFPSRSGFGLQQLNEVFSELETIGLLRFGKTPCVTKSSSIFSRIFKFFVNNRCQ